MEFIETTNFTKYIYDYLNEEEYHLLQWSLSINPDLGAVIPNSGEIRKLRWAAKGKGKSGEIRIIYYNISKDNQIWLLTVYGKNEISNISPNVLKLIKEELEND